MSGLPRRTSGQRAELYTDEPGTRLCHADGTATPAAAAGLDRSKEMVEGVDYVGGWIMLADGDQRGAVRIIDGTGNTIRGSTLNTTLAASTSSMESITAEPVDGVFGQDIAF